MNATPYMSKPGLYGMLYSFKIEIIPRDHGDDKYMIYRWAYDEEDAAERIAADPMIEGDDFQVLGRVRA
jgi:hypothetical protein